MKKSILSGAVVALTFAGLVGCTEEAKADVTVFGQVEMAMDIDADSKMDMVGDNILGFKASEDLGNGNRAYVQIDFNTEEETEGYSAQLKNRETYVGLDMGSVNVQAGRQKNLSWTMANGIDAFQGRGHAADNAARVTNSVKVSTTVSGITLAASTMLDGTENADTVGETRELGVAFDVAGINVSAVNQKDSAGETSTTYAGKATVGGATVAVAYEPDLTNVRTTVVGTMDIGANTLRGGYAMIDGSDNVVTAEAAHNLSKNTSIFANYQKDLGDEDGATMIGMAVRF